MAHLHSVHSAQSVQSTSRRLKLHLGPFEPSRIAVQLICSAVTVVARVLCPMSLWRLEHKSSQVKELALTS